MENGTIELVMVFSNSLQYLLTLLAIASGVFLCAAFGVYLLLEPKDGFFAFLGGVWFVAAAVLLVTLLMNASVVMPM